MNLGTADPSGILSLPELSTDMDLTMDQITLRANYRIGMPAL